MLMARRHLPRLTAACSLLLVTAAVGPAAAQTLAVAPEVDRVMEAFRLDAHIPGMVWGIVQDGRLVHVKAAGLQGLAAKRPVTADTRFRIASMSKAFTALAILKLRDDGKLSLDATADTYVPELRGWTYPTADAPRIRVRDLLNHTAGFVTDDPWGDRQTPLPDAEFGALLKAGVPFTRTPGTAMEYSNLGYALLGRIVTNVSGQPYADYIKGLVFARLGMPATGYDVRASPAEQRALGYRWQDDAWTIEPTMGPGAFGAMGGIETTANDYARWIGFLLAAWPPRDDADDGPVRRATIRELAQGSNFPSLRLRGGATATDACRLASTYGMGFIAAQDCELGLTLSHGGGYPGYGSHVLLLPDYGIGIFAFANRTYAGPRPPVWDAAVAMLRAGLLKPRAIPVSPALSTAYAAVARIAAAGSIEAGGDVLAMNMPLDRDAAHWARDLAALKAGAGTCDTSAPIEPTGALSGRFTWMCERGRVRGSLLLAPTRDPRIQDLDLSRVAP
jgi:CubicO group peptidase (beta-lactamase class C family)